MHIRSHISAIAFAVAALAAPQAALAQLSLDVDLGAGASEGGIGVDAGVDLGIGDTNLDVDAGVDVGGGSLVDADAGVDINSDRSGDGTSVDIDAEILGEDEVLDADVSVGHDTPATNRKSTAGNNSDPLLGVRISALDDAARLDALIGQIEAPSLSDTDLDSLIDDTRVSILALADLLGEEETDDIRALIEVGGSGREQLLAAVDASVELGAILDRHGLSTDDVVTLSVNDDGSAELVVLDLDVDLADAGREASSSNDVVDLDIDLLTDDELARIDLALLPDEDQRVDALVRLLGRDNGAAASGPVEVISVDAFLSRQSLAELDLRLGGESGDDILLNADLLDALADQGLSTDAVIGVDAGDGGATRLFVDANLGDDTELAQTASLDLSLGGTGDDADAGAEDGGGAGTDDGATGSIGDSPADGSTGAGGDGGDVAEEGDGDATNAGNDSLVSDTGSLPGALEQTDLAAGFLDTVTVAEVGCSAGLGALSGSDAPAPGELGAIDSLALVRIEGCVATLQQDDVAALRAAVEALPELSRSVDDAGLALDDLVGGTLEDATLTLYFDVESETAV